MKTITSDCILTLDRYILTLRMPAQDHSLLTIFYNSVNVRTKIYITFMLDRIVQQRYQFTLVYMIGLLTRIFLQTVQLLFYRWCEMIEFAQGPTQDSLHMSIVAKISPVFLLSLYFRIQSCDLREDLFRTNINPVCTGMSPKSIVPLECLIFQTKFLKKQASGKPHRTASDHRYICLNYFVHANFINIHFRLITINRIFKMQSSGVRRKQLKVLTEPQTPHGSPRAHLLRTIFPRLAHIDENDLDSKGHAENIFTKEILQKLPPNYLQKAKSYEIVGYNQIKNYNIKKQKKKPKLPRADSSSTKFSKYSSIPSSNQKDLSARQEEIPDEKVQLEAKNTQIVESSLYQRSKCMLQKFQKLWKRQDKKFTQKLKRQQNTSLIALSDAYKLKAEILEENTLKEKLNNINSDGWYRSLRTELNAEDLYFQKYTERIQNAVAKKKFAKQNLIHSTQLTRRVDHTLKQDILKAQDKRKLRYLKNETVK